MKMKTRIERRRRVFVGIFLSRGGLKSGTLGLLPDGTASHLHLQDADGVRAEAVRSQEHGGVTAKDKKLRLGAGMSWHLSVGRGREAPRQRMPVEASPDILFLLAIV